MNRDQARDIVLAAALPTAFEAACLVGCALAQGRPAAVIEFDRGDAAGRLTLLLTRLGVAAEHEVQSGGGRRRYDLQRVHVPEAQRAATARMIAAAWRQGRQALLGDQALGASSPRHAQRLTLAHAAWRAALLAGGRRRRGDLTSVRLGDHEMAAVLVRAARLLDVATEVSRRPGCVMVAVAGAPGITHA
ncbi:hypothetical protein ODJ79_21010 [Actinoplanes sp. KI2]|uniref:hypothetical protein n=1 Tax=Actinoplanes sp. KI2 TaxID=2983315 RepID=UPI0021D5B16A|nr:hypothetical protein [Actinoplanes sp. KI2]MCU7726215.1 hypothetical protein [Actinoplanes sp. KI2]